MKPVYMDHHATTPVDPDVLDVMMPFFSQEFGNPSSNTHEYGHRAREAVELARVQIAELIAASSPDEIVFTSGATEANNLAVKGSARSAQQRSGRNLITLPIEHKSVLDPVARLEKEDVNIRYCRVNQYGRIDLEHLRSLLNADTVLVSVQAANSEIGTLQPLTEIAAIVRQYPALFHVDAVQAAGRVPLNVYRDSIDLLSLSAHKMYGPKGVGALYVRKGLRLTPLLDGGGHERGLRSGTYNVPGIAGMGKAAELAGRNLDEHSRAMRALQQRLWNGLLEQIKDIQLNGHPEHRLANNLNIAFTGVDGGSLVLSCPDVALSTGSACTSASPESSYVLKALQIPAARARCSVRFGLGKGNTQEQVDTVIDSLSRAVAGIRQRSILPQFR